MAATNFTFNNFSFASTSTRSGALGGADSDLITSGSRTSFSSTMSPLAFFAPSITVQPLTNSFRPTQPITTPSTTPPKMDAVIALLSMKPQDALNPNGSNQVGAAKTAEQKTGQVAATIDKAQKQLAGADPTKTNNTVMTPPPPSPTISFVGTGGPSLFSAWTSKKDKGTPMFTPAPVADPAANAVNFTATQPTALLGARPLGANGVRPQGPQLLDAANTTSDYLGGLKIKNLDKTMGQIGQRSFEIGAAARNTLIDAGLRNPTATAMVYKPLNVGKPSPVSV